MKYETAIEMAQRLGVTPRLVQLWAKEGKLSGAVKQGRDWLIPSGMERPKRGMLVHNAEGVSLPLLSGAYNLGEVYETICAMHEGDEKNLALAEFYYFTGDFEKAVFETELFFNHKDEVTKLSACLIYSFANVALGNEEHASMGFGCIEESLEKEVDKDHITLRQKAMCKMIDAVVDVFLHRRVPEEDFAEYIKYLPRGLQVWSCCILANAFFLKKDFNRALGIVDTIISVSTKVYPLSMAYIHIVGAMSYMELKNVEMAKKHMMKAWEYSSEDGFIQPFAESHGLLYGLVDTCLKKDYPKEYSEIVRLSAVFTKQWRNVHNNYENKDLAASLTTTEFAISMLASRGWSNQEIANYMELSLHTVKRYISIVYQKLAITSRAELKKYMH